MAKSINRKKSEKIYSQINKIAQKGKDYLLEYRSLIDDIIAKGDYAYLEMCLSFYYKIEAVSYKTVHDLKRDTWKQILFQTDSSLISKLKRLYREKNVYQQGMEIRSEDLSYLSISKTGPYLSEEAIIATSYGTDSKKRKYTPLSASMSQIEVGKAASGIEISILDDMIYMIEVSKVSWATFSSVAYPDFQYAREASGISTISASGTHSHLLPGMHYKSGIPTSHGGDYLITTYRRGDSGWLEPGLRNEEYSYKVELRKDNLLGTITEIDYDEPAYEYLQRNKKFAELMKVKKTFLQVEKVGATSSITIIYDDIRQSEENNLYSRYKIAIDYLNS